ncbi:MAG TPA: hypothetical protein VG015_01290 [Candidatus Dormibacteraeota bacterium]|jgi:hypothetical protein|nr:hypothetical protein [Candidatus Dormibacteraeota bacterium]
MSVAAEPSLAPFMLIRGLGHWLGQNLRMALVSAVVGAVIGYISNVWLIAVEYNGYVKVPPGAPAVGEGNTLNGQVFWAIAMTVSFAVWSFYRGKGVHQLVDDLRALPESFRLMLTDAGARARVGLLWGAAGGLLITSFVSPWIGAALGLGLVACVAGFLGRVVVALAMRIWQAVAGKVAPTAQPPSSAVMMVAILGGAGTTVLGLILPSDLSLAGLPGRLVLGVAFGGVAFFSSRPRSRQGPSVPAGAPPLASFLVLGAGATLAGLAYVLAHPVTGIASDGGFQECVGQLWITCQGATGVLQHGLDGVGPSAVGAVVGSSIGDGLSGISGDGTQDAAGGLGDPGSGQLGMGTWGGSGSDYAAGPGPGEVAMNSWSGSGTDATTGPGSGEVAMKSWAGSGTDATGGPVESGGGDGGGSDPGSTPDGNAT